MRRSPVYKAVNKPLTLMGCDRRLFFAAVTTGAAFWNALNSLVGGGVLAIGAILVARHITQKDPQLPRILLNSSKWRTQYDPLKTSPR